MASALAVLHDPQSRLKFGWVVTNLHTFTVLSIFNQICPCHPNLSICYTIFSILAKSVHFYPNLPILSNLSIFITILPFLPHHHCCRHRRRFPLSLRIATSTRAGSQVHSSPCPLKGFKGSQYIRRSIQSKNTSKKKKNQIWRQDTLTV